MSSWTAPRTSIATATPADSYESASLGGKDGFVSVFDANGNFQWARRFGGATNDYVHGVTFDSNNNLYIIGNATGDVVDLNGDGDTADSFETSGWGDQDVFLTSLDSSLATRWIKRLGGAGSDRGRYALVDSNDNIITVSTFYEDADLDGDGNTTDTNETITSFHGDFDICMSVFNSSGTHQWSKRLGGVGNDKVQGAMLDTHDNIIIAGYYGNTGDLNGDGDLDDSWELLYHGGTDGFVSVFDVDGNHQWSRKFGSVSNDRTVGLAVDTMGNVYVGGRVEAADAVADLNGDGDCLDTDETNPLGESDIFFVKYSGPAGTLASVNENNRSADIVYMGGAFTSNTQYFWRIRFQDLGGDWGDWSPSEGTNHFTTVGIDHYVVTAVSPQTQNVGFTGTVTAEDSGNNTVVVDSYTVITVTNTGTANFYTDATYSVTTDNYTLTNGIARIYVKDATAHTITISAVDPDTKVGTSSDIVIDPDPVSYGATTLYPVYLGTTVDTVDETPISDVWDDTDANQHEINDGGAYINYEMEDLTAMHMKEGEPLNVSAVKLIVRLMSDAGCLVGGMELSGRDGDNGTAYDTWTNTGDLTSYTTVGDNNGTPSNDDLIDVYAGGCNTVAKVDDLYARCFLGGTGAPKHIYPTKIYAIVNYGYGENDAATGGDIEGSYGTGTKPGSTGRDTHTGYIWSGTDVDYILFNVTNGEAYEVILRPPYGKNYDVDVRNSFDVSKATGTNSGDRTEVVKFTADETAVWAAKISGSTSSDYNKYDTYQVQIAETTYYYVDGSSGSNTTGAPDTPASPYETITIPTPRSRRTPAPT